VYCAICHGDQGEGIATLGPEILHPPREQAIWLVRNGDAEPHHLYVGPMIAVPPEAISDAWLAEILDWLWEPPNPATGAELFADYCAYCHGEDGRGGADEYVSAYHSAPFTRRVGQAFIDYVRVGHVMDDSGAAVGPDERHAYMPPFPAEVLSDAELMSIEAWLP